MANPDRFRVPVETYNTFMDLGVRMFAAREAGRLIRVHNGLTEKATRDSIYAGVAPGEVFSAEGIELCEDFIAYAASLGFRRAKVIRDIEHNYAPMAAPAPPRHFSKKEIFFRSKPTRLRLEDEHETADAASRRAAWAASGVGTVLFEARGYPIGTSKRVPVPDKDGKVPGRVFADVYLCEDGMIRLPHGETLAIDNEGQFAVPTICNPEKGEKPHVNLMPLEARLYQLAFEIGT